MSGILAYGSYLPYRRLTREQIATVLGAPAGRGARSVASYDEDTTSMAVEAGRAALAGTVGGVGARQLFFSTTRPGYLDKTNACVVHAALGLDQDVFATDMVGSVRSGVGAVRAALSAAEPTLAVAADIRIGLPGSADESEGGDAAAALLCAASGDFVAELIGTSTATAEFLDRWRAPGDLTARVWEERFGEFAYVPLADAAVGAALKSAHLTAGDIDHLIVTGTHSRAVRAVTKRVGARPEALVDDLSSTVGTTGAAHPALLLCDVLDRASAGQVVALVVLADGVDVLLFRTTAALEGRRQAQPVRAQIASTRDDLGYARYLAWRGTLRMEPPRRPDPVAPAAPPSLRSEDWKFAFVGSRCTCGTLHLPPARVCMSCRRVDEMTPAGVGSARGTIATFTIDHLAYSESPPTVVGVIDFDGGGRVQCQLTDVDAEQVSVGARVEMTFRKLFTANGVHNYFWKARPVRGEI